MSNVKFVNVLLFKMEKVNCIVGVMHAHAELFLSLPPPVIYCAIFSCPVAALNVIHLCESVALCTFDV